MTNTNDTSTPFYKDLLTTLFSTIVVAVIGFSFMFYIRNNTPAPTNTGNIMQSTGIAVSSTGTIQVAT